MTETGAALYIDTETTGFEEPEVIELATKGPFAAPHDWDERVFVQRFKPTKPIEVGALATHHILESDLADCVPWAGLSIPATVGYLVGHGVDFDWEAIGKPNVKRICTLALARLTWPQLGSHKLGACYYHVHRSDPAIARHKLRSAHSAVTDLEICAELLELILRMASGAPDDEAARRIGDEPHPRGGHGYTWEQVWDLSEHARIPKVMPFGKHVGMPIKDLPWDYRAWILRQQDFDPYLVKAVREAQHAP